MKTLQIFLFSIPVLGMVSTFVLIFDPVLVCYAALSTIVLTIVAIPAAIVLSKDNRR